ncbi:MAG: ABC transporter ATP-binding protein [Ardenticatenaceae bacterium]|nr:ABC transporter ATP-binding protein [Anaerolineales bacterium]MCB8922127.1 ABC transporter ATP-binding protein [Ardenticatenaceae bacterium]MCB8991107.1 ABC transporter ATP-binding protein [Ardenticatenaceae bacterium]
MNGVDVQFRNVTQVFGALVALREVELAVQPGAFVSIVGPSGCGKSTLLRLAAGLLTPSAGEALLGGRPPQQLRAQKQIGWMAQRPALLPWRTVRQNVLLPQQLTMNNEQLTINDSQFIIHYSPDELLKLVGLFEFADAYPHTLSGGMQQRAALARMLAIGASLWLMDEPFAALDELTRESLGGELLALWRQFRPTVLWVTHHLAEAVRLSDRIILLSPRPGMICGDIPVTLPHPRDDTAPAFQDVLRRARSILQAEGNGRV